MPLNEKARFDRRKLMAGTTGAVGALLLGGCDRLSEDPTVQRVLASAESVTRRMQRLLGGNHSLAPEYAEADLSKEFKANGTLDPDDDDYQALASKQFVDWRLEVTGLVNRPAQYSLDELRAMPSRTQITRHDCVEGWSCIGKWKGALLGDCCGRPGLSRPPGMWCSIVPIRWTMAIRTANITRALAWRRRSTHRRSSPTR